MARFPRPNPPDPEELSPPLRLPLRAHRSRRIAFVADGVGRLPLIPDRARSAALIPDQPRPVALAAYQRNRVTRTAGRTGRLPFIEDRAKRATLILDRARRRTLIADRSRRATLVPECAGWLTFVAPRFGWITLRANGFRARGRQDHWAGTGFGYGDVFDLRVQGGWRRGHVHQRHRVTVADTRAGVEDSVCSANRPAAQARRCSVSGAGLVCSVHACPSHQYSSRPPEGG
ncbi:hypothetical protein AW168_24280 [Nocardia brasiliensis]|uniref:Uncharacterized protein n=1 Tax=Nocardia brasiliensis (strain ATCC 700358 / HUJEG-1) TaxID=1133849 RepID=K0EZ59_NOCB7|nr:hypothetical protein O3I_021130 [Nocardia brasiliensis ATCC 700358]OCF87616.1 hypothetical protein AW168_24280 [Nocardia brasiliensis]